MADKTKNKENVNSEGAIRNKPGYIGARYSSKTRKQIAEKQKSVYMSLPSDMESKPIAPTEETQVNTEHPTEEKKGKSHITKSYEEIPVGEFKNKIIRGVIKTYCWITNKTPAGILQKRISILEQVKEDFDKEDQNSRENYINLVKNRNDLVAESETLEFALKKVDDIIKEYDVAQESALEQLNNFDQLSEDDKKNYIKENMPDIHDKKKTQIEKNELAKERLRDDIICYSSGIKENEGYSKELGQRLDNADNAIKQLDGEIDKLEAMIDHRKMIFYDTIKNVPTQLTTTLDAVEGIQYQDQIIDSAKKISRDIKKGFSIFAQYANEQSKALYLKSSGNNDDDSEIPDSDTEASQEYIDRVAEDKEERKKQREESREARRNRRYRR